MNSAGLSENENVDDEWANFMLKFSGISVSSDRVGKETEIEKSKKSFDLYESDACPVLMDEIAQTNANKSTVVGGHILKEAPKCSELHISTKTKVLYLNCPIDTVKTFWSVPVIDYWRPIEGVIKKQTKITSFSQEELDEMQERLRSCGHHYTEMIIKSASTHKVMPVPEPTTVPKRAGFRTYPDSKIDPIMQTPKRLKFKDDRKVTIGIAKKDIMNCRGKQKKAFMNCFAMIIRFFYKGEFREVHVKVFNTGKLEIPGVPDDNMLRLVREKVIEYLQPHLEVCPLQYIKGTGDDGDEDVLINSGFHCGFCIDQKAFYTILRSDKYGIETSYDSCHYPGIRCKYYYRNDLEKDHPEQGRICLEDNGIKLSQLELSKKYTCVSFMIFSTGNCLVVGNCSKVVLLHVFEFIKRTLEVEYAAICLPNESVATKLKKKKQRKKTVHMQMHYYSSSTA
jgi:hypothetical protein